MNPRGREALPFSRRPQSATLPTFLVGAHQGTRTPTLLGDSRVFSLRTPCASGRLGRTRTSNSGFVVQCDLRLHHEPLGWPTGLAPVSRGSQPRTLTVELRPPRLCFRTHRRIEAERGLARRSRADDGVLAGETHSRAGRNQGGSETQPNGRDSWIRTSGLLLPREAGTTKLPHVPI